MTREPEGGTDPKAGSPGSSLMLTAKSDQRLRPMAEERIRVSLRLDPRSDAISGELRRERAAALRFYGWLELISALDAIHGRGRSDGDRSAASGSDSGRSVKASRKP